MVNLEVMAGENLYIVPDSDVNKLVKDLRNELGVSGNKFQQKIVESIETISKPHNASYHQNGFDCGDCIHCYALPSKQIECRYKDPIISTNPRPPVQETCEWLTIYRLALEHGLLEPYRKTE